MVGKKILVEEFQNDCLVLVNLSYANGVILATSESPCSRSLPSSFCSRG